MLYNNSPEILEHCHSQLTNQTNNEIISLQRASNSSFNVTSQTIQKAPIYQLKSTTTQWERTRCVTCAFSNLRSIRNKLRELNCFVNAENIDILGVAESWLTKADPDLLFNNINHNGFRRDKDSRGGSLLLLVHKNLIVKQTNNFEKSEIMSVYISFAKTLVRFILLYLPHPVPNILKNYLKQLKTLINFPGTCLVMGDFNIDFNKVVNSDVSKCNCEGIFKKKFIL